jgi:hypothetical protein
MLIKIKNLNEHKTLKLDELYIYIEGGLNIYILNNQIVIR